MTKEQLIKIAKAGFPDRVKEIIDIDSLEFIQMGNVYRLYIKGTEFNPMLPKNQILAINIQPSNYVHINAEFRAFDHYAAIKKMIKLGLIK